jgi:16S rRNA U1498 N3-methylase RsmE
MIYIKDKQHHFLKNVLRVKINDQINIFDGISGEWKTNVISVNRDNTVLRVTKNISKFPVVNIFSY